MSRKTHAQTSKYGRDVALLPKFGAGVPWQQEQSGEGTYPIGSVIGSSVELPLASIIGQGAMDLIEASIRADVADAEARKTIQAQSGSTRPAAWNRPSTCAVDAATGRMTESLPSGYKLRAAVYERPYWSRPWSDECLPATFAKEVRQDLSRARFIGARGCAGICPGCGNDVYVSAAQNLEDRER